MTDNGSERARKAFKQVEHAATAARRTVTDAMRTARAESRRQENYMMSREVKRLKEEHYMSNDTIADELGISESSVRAYLLMKIPGEV